MTAQILQFPLADTLDRVALEHAATALNLAVDPTATDADLRAAVRAGVRQVVTATPPTGTAGTGHDLTADDLARLTDADLAALRDGAAALCTEPDCRPVTEHVARDAAHDFARALRDVHLTWRAARSDSTGTTTTWTAPVSAAVTRLVARTTLYAAALADAARRHGCEHVPATALVIPAWCR